MKIFIVVILVVLGIICAIIHKEKGYSPIAGFAWGFFFSVIGLIVVLLEKDKEEHDMQIADGKGLSLAQWLLIVFGIGIALIIILVIVLTLM